MSTRKQILRAEVRRRTKELRRAIGQMDFVVSGTLHTRTKVCGKKNCRCARDPELRHGPYHEWTRRVEGRLRHSVVGSNHADLLKQAIENYREIQRILAAWEQETENVILDNS